MSSFVNISQTQAVPVGISFSNRGMVKAFGSGQISNLTPNAAALVAASKSLAKYEFEKKAKVGTKSIPEFLGLHYIGYIIDKERMLPNGGWTRTDEYKIIGSSALNFKDSRVAYGRTYRYRIRAVVKLTLEEVEDDLEKSALAENIKKFEANLIAESMEVNQFQFNGQPNLNNGLAPKVAVQSAAATATAHAALLEGTAFVATPEESKIVAEPVSNDSNNIKAARRLKNLGVSSLDLIQGTASSSELKRMFNEKLKGVKTQKVKHVSYYYESRTSPWQYVNIVEEVPPPPPSDIKIVPNSDKEEILITWLKPANSQRDIVGYRLYRRRSINSPWALVSEFEKIENLYIDSKVSVGNKYIYALTCIDIHGFESFLSIQTQAELNANFINEKEEKPLKWISGSGAKPSEINVIFKKFYEPNEQIIAQRNVVIKPSKNFSETSQDMVIRITSLDTHEQKEFKVRLRNVNNQKVDGE